METLTSLIDPIITTGTNRDRTTERAPGRAFTFLSALGGSPLLREQMRRAGYTDAVHAQGWEHLKTAETASGTGGGPTGNPITDAKNTLTLWSVPGFKRIRAALAHLHGEQESFVFTGLEADNKVPVIVAIDMLLDRLDTLEGIGAGADARKATADSDKKAIATLAERGFDAAERKRLRELVKIAESAPTGSVDPSTGSREAALAALVAWYDDWSDTARTVFGKRGDLIKLGLAKRTVRKSASSAPVVSVTPAAAPAPAITPPVEPVTRA